VNPCTNSSDTQTGPRVSFEVLGKNPFWVYSKNEDGKIGTFKRFQRGQLGIGDMFCLSAKDRVWFTVKEVEKEVVDERESKGGEIERRVNDELSQSLESSYGVKGNGDIGLDAVDVSSIDTVRGAIHFLIAFPIFVRFVLLDMLYFGLIWHFLVVPQRTLEATQLVFRGVVQEDMKASFALWVLQC